MMMSPKLFTLAEANALLPALKPLMQELLERRARVSHEAIGIRPLLGEYRSNVGSWEMSQMTQDFATIERLLDEIRGYGCVVKDINGGLLDFLSERDGRLVYLCWKYNEPEIAFYHELHTGFAGREPV